MPNWYAVYTKPRQEVVAVTHLRQQEFGKRSVPLLEKEGFRGDFIR